MSKNLAVALGLREKTEKDFANMLTDMHGKFKNSQGLFQGFRYDFKPFDGHPDQPEQRKTQMVSSTVEEQLDWLKQYSKEYLDIRFSIEKTNAQGVTAPLVVEGVKWGDYTSLELLSLRTWLENKLRGVIQIIPIRPDGTKWVKSTDPEYDGREVFEDITFTGRTKTTIKRTVVVDDPMQTANPNIVRQPVTQTIDTPTETGEFSKQHFTGAWTNRQRAQLEVTLNTLHKAVVEAMETANGTQLVESDLGDKVLGYLLK